MKTLLAKPIFAIVVCASATLPSDALGQQAAPKACTSAEYQQFDYWVGEWDVFGANDQKIGTNKITRISGGCALLEQWEDARGGSGTSINYYDAADKRWHQVWMGGNGVALQLHGNLVDGAMELSGDERITPKGKVRDRIRWTALPDQSVEQLWSNSTDGGATWSVVFRGIYRHARMSTEDPQ